MKSKNKGSFKFMEYEKLFFLKIILIKKKWVLSCLAEYFFLVQNTVSMYEIKNFLANFLLLYEIEQSLR